MGRVTYRRTTRTACTTRSVGHVAPIMSRMRRPIAAASASSIASMSISTRTGTEGAGVGAVTASVANRPCSIGSLIARRVAAWVA